MTALPRVLIALVSLVASGAAVRAADAPAGPAPAAPAAATSAAATLTAIPVAKDGSVSVKIDRPAADEKREPVVQRTVIDDGRAMIEELRVRGQLVKATVHPKDGSPSYEIIVGDGSRELSTEGRNNSRGATGKRVWQVLSF